MQKKIGTILNAELIKEAKKKAAAKHTTLNNIFEEALSEYLARQTDPSKKLSAVEISFGVLKLPRQVVETIATEDLYDSECN